MFSRITSCVKSLIAPFFAIFLIAGCAYKTKANGINDVDNNYKAGRISLQIKSESPQSFFAGFELKGNARQGELTLISPIGTILSILRWSPLETVMESGREVQRFESMDALLEKTTGAAIPVAALFDWLEGKNTSFNGWIADVSQQGNGRITARRVDPAPQADLRIVLDQ